ncbi:hypothetical protein, partial [Escherichia coli]|uniref:hypothetical protein n=1 Tax=Escherichia coli TaxID=562 RepID=UPI0019544979
VQASSIALAMGSGRAYLARFPIRTAGIEGIGQALTANLAAVGIRTAADFVGVSQSATSSK